MTKRCTAVPRAVRGFIAAKTKIKCTLADLQ